MFSNYVLLNLVNDIIFIKDSRLETIGLATVLSIFSAYYDTFSTTHL